jgi:hypothetical protein
MANQIEYRQLWAPTAIAATETTIYTASPASTTGVVKNISAVITNTTTSGITVEVWVKATSGTAAAAGNQLIASEVVPANGRLPFTIPDMTSSNVLTATGAATGLTIHSTSGIVIN